jgi:hypothetical protein
MSTSVVADSTLIVMVSGWRGGRIRRLILEEAFEKGKKNEQ